MHRFPILKYFKYEHLREPLRSISKTFSDLAYSVAERCEMNDGDIAETTVAIRKLLEAKDAAVRAAL